MGEGPAFTEHLPSAWVPGLLTYIHLSLSSPQPDKVCIILPTLRNQETEAQERELPYPRLPIW